MEETAVAGRETWSLLEMLVSHGDSTRVCSWLDDNRILKLRPQRRTKLLFLALYNDQLDMFEVLLNFSCSDVNQPLQNGVTLLHEVCKSGKVAFLEELIKYDADLNERDEDGRTPLHKAAREDNVEIIKCLLEHGCKLNPRTDGSGEPVLHYSIARSGYTTVEYLVSSGCSINERSRSGDTPLHVAVQEGRADVVKLLCEHGVNLRLLNRKGQDAMCCALVLGMWDIWDYFMEINGHMFSTLSDKTMLELASCLPMPKCFEIIKQLVHYGYDIGGDGWIWNDHAVVFKNESGADIRACIRGCALEVRTLTALSCNTIRNAIGKCLPSKLMNLPLPNKLKAVIQNCQV